MPTILITGISGFIGSHAAAHFKGMGYRVVGVDNRDLSAGLEAHVDRFELLTLPDEALDGLIGAENPELCIHCAGGASVAHSVEHPREDFLSHLPPTFFLLDSLRRQAPECKLIYVSSAAVYGNPKRLPVKEEDATLPISPYGFHKLECEFVCREFHRLYDLPVAIARIFSAYGPGLRKQLLWDICRKIKTGAVELFGMGEETRDFIHARDIAAAFQVISEKGDFQAGIYNLAGGSEIGVREVAETAVSASGKDVPITFTGVTREGDPKRWRAEMTKLMLLGFQPTVSFAEGVREYVKWCDETAG